MLSSPEPEQAYRTSRPSVVSAALFLLLAYLVSQSHILDGPRTACTSPLQSFTIEFAGLAELHHDIAVMGQLAHYVAQLLAQVAM